MIVIVEGIDRVGKTTLCKMLCKLGFDYFKDEWVIKSEIKQAQERLFSVGKLDTTIALLKQYRKNDRHIVVDRLHITELVYGKHIRGYEQHGNQMLAIDRQLAMLDPILVYVMPENIEKSSKEHGMDMKAMESDFYGQVASSMIKRKMYTKYSSLENVVDIIMDEIYQYDLYLASPFFNQEQVEREEAVKTKLRNEGFKVFSPKENCFLPPNASMTARETVFNENCNAIKRCKAVFAITDGKDIGTIWEAGYAYGIGKPVIYFAETLGDRGFNLMLAQSGRKVFLRRNEISRKEISSVIKFESEKFRGLIE